MFFLTLMGFVSLSLQPRRCLKTLSEAVTYTASWWRKKGISGAQKSFHQIPGSFGVYAGTGDQRLMLFRGSSSSWRGLLQYHANILSNSNDFIGWFNIQQPPPTKSNLVTWESSSRLHGIRIFFWIHKVEIRWTKRSLKWSFLSNGIDDDVRNPKFEQGPRYYVFSNGNSACNLYFYFAQIAQLYGIFSYI